MAWNRPGVSKQTDAALRRGEMPRPTIVRGLVAGLIVVLFSLGAWLFCSRSGEVQQIKTIHTDKSRRITEVTNVVKVAQVEDEVVETTLARRSVRKEHLETYVDGNGVLRYKIGDGRVPQKDDFKNPIRINRTSCIPAFRHETESEIAMLITLEPGEPLVGEADYRHTRRDFVESLVDKIEFNEDDTPYAREIKQAVIETKKELAERVKNGEDIVDILRDARQELQRSAAYKDEIDDILREQLHDPEASDEDLKTAVEAANKMLTDKGIAPIKEKSFMMRRRKIGQARKLRAAEQSAPAEN